MGETVGQLDGCWAFGVGYSRAAEGSCWVPYKLISPLFVAIRKKSIQFYAIRLLEVIYSADFYSPVGPFFRVVQLVLLKCVLTPITDTQISFTLHAWT